VAALYELGHDVTVLGRNPLPLAAFLQEHAGTDASGEAGWIPVEKTHDNSNPTETATSHEPGDLLIGEARPGDGRVRFLPVDLRDRPDVIAACRGQRFVYHLGALTAPWGKRQEFRAVNVAGTASVILGCRAHGVERLIHVSSPSVIFDYRDQFDLTDQTPYPRRASSEYAHTKMLAEVLVRRAIARGLPAVIVRPRAVFGPGDTTLFPRLLRAARSGRLPRIGTGDTVTDLTFVDNAVHALLLAMTAPGAVGRVLTITNGQPVALWPLIDRVLASQGLRTSAHTVPLPLAMVGASALEAAWRLLRLSGEPPATRYGLALLGYSQTFDIEAARDALGYAPVVAMEEGIQRFLEAFGEGPAQAERNMSAPTRPAPLNSVQPRDQTAKHQSTNGSASETVPIVSCDVLVAGYCLQSYRFLVAGGAHREVALAASFALLRHPRHGIILFDTGYAPRSKDATKHLPFSLYGKLLPTTIEPEWSAQARLAQRGIGADEVRFVVVSHFHADHIGGLRDYPRATFIAANDAYARVRGLKGLRALRAAFIPELLPEDFDTRLHLLKFDRSKETISNSNSELPARPASWSVFPRTLDLFGDGSLRDPNTTYSR
jgi:nucleoside-diphosphate-sugar epimerase